MDLTKMGIEEMGLVRKAREEGVWVRVSDRIAKLFRREETTESERDHIGKILLLQDHMILLEVIDNIPQVSIYNLERIKIATENDKILIAVESASSFMKSESTSVTACEKILTIGYATMEEVRKAEKEELPEVELIFKEPRD